MHLSKLIPALALIPLALPAQPLAARVAGVRAGTAQFTYASRSGVCGDGRDVVAYRRALFVWPSMESYGHWSGVRCSPGPMRAVLTVRDGRVTAVRAHVGGAGAAGVADLGAVPAREAAAYLLSFVAGARDADAPERVTRDALMAAALADSADVAPDLLRIARDASRSRETRRRAVHWAGVVGDSSAVPPLAALATDPATDTRVREGALFALLEAGEGAGVPTVIAIAERDSSVDVRKKATFWLSQTDDPRARPTLRRLAGDARAPLEVRKTAIFALSQGDRSDDDLRYLVDLFGRLEERELKEQVIFAVSQLEDEEGMRWMMRLAADRAQGTGVRKKALFWAGQGGVSVAELARAYDALTEPELKEHLIFVLSQRDDEAALDKLMAIARADPDRQLRKKALFWLGQKDDPRVARFVRELLAK
jgi:HEAT repeat protein